MRNLGFECTKNFLSEHFRYGKMQRHFFCNRSCQFQTLARDNLYWSSGTLDHELDIGIVVTQYDQTGRGNRPNQISLFSSNAFNIPQTFQMCWPYYRNNSNG